MILYQNIEKNISLEAIYDIVAIEKQGEFLLKYLSRKTKDIEIGDGEQMINELYKNLHEESIEEMAKKLSYSKRHMNRLFYKHFGVNPKTMLNILRLHKSLDILLHQRTNNLTELAIICGFYDQSHFIKDIKKYCGISPTELLNKYNV